MELRLSPDGLDGYAYWISQFVKSRGFFTPSNVDHAEAMLSKLMLVVTEIAEAAEAVRRGDQQNFNEEIADAVIRLLDICGAGNISIQAELDCKMAKNMKREYKHGKVC